MMANREQMESCMEKAESVIEQVQKVFDDARRVQPGTDEEYTNAQMMLEEMSGELDDVLRAATPEQREALNRKQQQIRQLQNNMILKR
ncbi:MULTISPECIES: YtzC family protein [Alkalihalophilus]|nr:MULTISPECIES: YtzC family protein [Alkalihalophilus]MED1601788.1 YtzC family protein [Alkalihalophilus marmarensis]